MLIYGTLWSLLYSKINLWKYKEKYCVLFIPECWGAYSAISQFSFLRNLLIVLMSSSWKYPLWHPVGPSLQTAGHGCLPKLPDRPCSEIRWKGEKKHPCKTHPIRRKNNVFIKRTSKMCPLSFRCISSVNRLVYQKCSLSSIIAQITFKQMSECPLFVWLKHFKEYYSF